MIGRVLSYASDVTDAEWALIAPRLPPRHQRGRPRETELHSVVNALFYMIRTVCQWRQLPREFPPYATVQYYFYAWRDQGVLQTTELLLEARQPAGREASPSAGVIDSRSVKTTESDGPRGGACPRARHSRDPRDAAKKVKGRKRHIVTETAGMMIGAAIHPADVQDRDGARIVIEAIHDLFPWLRHLFPWLRHLFADSAYSGDKLLKALAKFGRWSIEIVKRVADTVGFEVLPRRWVVERTFAWLNRNRRLAKDLEASIASAKGWVYLASIQLLIRRMARL